MSVFTDDLEIEGQNLDEVYFQAGHKPKGLLDEMFADKTNEKSPDGTGTGLITDWIRVFNIQDRSGSIEEKRNRLIATIRARGGLSPRYFALILQALGYNLTRDYVTSPVRLSEVPEDIIEYDGGVFIISDQLTDIPAPTQIYDDPPLWVALFDDDILYRWTVRLHGVTSAADAERTLNTLRPAWTTVDFEYV